MSLLDPETEIIDRCDESLYREQIDQQSWANFQHDILAHRIARLKEGKTLTNKFAIGMGVPENFTIDFEQSLESLCKAEGVVFYHLDCRSVTSLHNAMGYLMTISRGQSLVILLEHFDEIPTSPEKSYIENVLIRIWERDFIMPRNRYLVLFTTSNDKCLQKPAKLNKIKSLEWHKSIRDFKKEWHIEK